MKPKLPRRKELDLRHMLLSKRDSELRLLRRNASNKNNLLKKDTERRRGSDLKNSTVKRKLERERKRLLLWRSRDMKKMRDRDMLRSNAQERKKLRTRDKRRG